MGRVLANNVSLSMVQESALGVPGTTGWEKLQPNTITNFGATTTRVARSPISRNRQRKKGTIVDLSSAVEFDADLTIAGLRSPLAGFMFADIVNSDVTNLAVGAVTGARFTLDTAMVAAQITRFPIGALVWAQGFNTGSNDGLHRITAAAAIGVNLQADGLVAQAAADGSVSFAGYRRALVAADRWIWNNAAKQATYTAAGLGTILGDLGLEPGMFVNVGSVATTGGAIQNGIRAGEYGLARVRSVAANVIVFDKVATALRVVADMAPAGAVDILFGEFARNYPTDAAEYSERSYQIEAAFPGLDVGGVDAEYEYAKGNYCNTLAINLPLTDKATMSVGFVGTDTEPPTSTRLTGAATAADPIEETAFNTSADIARLRITDTDDDGLTTDFKSISLTIANNVSPEKVVGTVGTKFLATGNFFIDITAQLLFTSGEVTEAIRNNQTVSMDFAVRNTDGMIVFDIPSMTLGGGGKEYPVNQSVLVNTTAEAFEDEALGTSIGITFIPVPVPA